RQMMAELLEKDRHQLADWAPDLGVKKVHLPQPIIERVLGDLPLLRIRRQFGENLALAGADLLEKSLDGLRRHIGQIVLLQPGGHKGRLVWLERGGRLRQGGQTLAGRGVLGRARRRAATAFSSSPSLGETSSA